THLNVVLFTFNLGRSLSDLTLMVVRLFRNGRVLPSFPTRRSSDLRRLHQPVDLLPLAMEQGGIGAPHLLRQHPQELVRRHALHRSEEHTSELQSRFELVCRLLLEKKKCGHTYNLTEGILQRTQGLL